MTRSFENLAPEEVAALLTACGVALAATKDIPDSTANKVFAAQMQLVSTIKILTKAIS